MRRSFTVAVALLLALLSAAVQAPAATQAAALARHTFVTGRLVAAPGTVSPTGNASLLVQAGARTVLVRVTGGTRYFNRAWERVTLGALRNGDLLQVSGSADDMQVTASYIRDLSLPETVILQLRGQLAAPVPATGPLCLANAVILGVTLRAAQAPAVSPCPAGQLPIYLTAATRVLDRSGESVGLKDLRAGDTLLVRGSLVNGQIFAQVIRDTTLPDVVNVRVKGQLAAPVPATGPLCLANAVILGVTPRAAQAPAVSPCPAGQLPIYPTAATRYTNHKNLPILPASLRVGDSLGVGASLINGQLIAYLIQDLSL